MLSFVGYFNLFLYLFLFDVGIHDLLCFVVLFLELLALLESLTNGHNFVTFLFSLHLAKVSFSDDSSPKISKFAVWAFPLQIIWRRSLSSATKNHPSLLRPACSLCLLGIGLAI